MPTSLPAAGTAARRGKAAARSSNSNPNIIATGMESADPWLGSVHRCRPLVGAASHGAAAAARVLRRQLRPVRDRCSRDGQLGPIVIGVEPRYLRYRTQEKNQTNNKLRDKRLDKRQDDCLSSQVPAGNDRSDVPKRGGITYHL